MSTDAKTSPSAISKNLNLLLKTYRFESRDEVDLCFQWLEEVLMEYKCNIESEIGSHKLGAIAAYKLNRNSQITEEETEVLLRQWKQFQKDKEHHFKTVRKKLRLMSKACYKDVEAQQGSTFDPTFYDILLYQGLEKDQLTGQTMWVELYNKPLIIRLRLHWKSDKLIWSNFN